MINKKQVEKEYLNIIKNNEKIENTIKEESNIVFNLTIGILSVYLGSFLLNIENIFYILLGIFIFVLYKNQKLIDFHIYNNLVDSIETSKVAAIISKGYFNKIFIKIFILNLLYFITFFKEFVIFYLIMEIMINLYFMSFKNKYCDFYIAYLYKRIKLYIENDLYSNMIEQKFIQTYGEQK